jgi:hypothetical protein
MNFMFQVDKLQVGLTLHQNGYEAVKKTFGNSITILGRAPPVPSCSGHGMVHWLVCECNSEASQKVNFTKLVQAQSVNYIIVESTNGMQKKNSTPLMEPQPPIWSQMDREHALTPCFV